MPDDLSPAERRVETLLTGLRDGAPAFAPTGGDTARHTVARRRTRRNVVAGGALALVVAALLGVTLPGGSDRVDGVVGAVTGEDDTDDDLTDGDVTPGPSPEPTASPPQSASPSQTVMYPPGDARSLTEERLGNTTFQVPGWDAFPECPSGDLTFVDGIADGGDLSVIVAPGVRVPSYANVVGDDVPEALVRVRCAVGPGDDGIVADALLVLRPGDGGTVQTVGAIFTGDTDARGYQDSSINGQVVTVLVIESPFDRVEADWRTQTRAYGWNGSRFSQVSGPEAFEGEAPAVADLPGGPGGPGGGPVAWEDATVRLPFQSMPHPDAGRCPGGDIDFTPSGSGIGRADVGDWTYEIRVLGRTQWTGGPTQVVLQFGCSLRSGSRTAAAVYVYEDAPAAPSQVGYITRGQLGGVDDGGVELGQMSVGGRTVTVTQVDVPDGGPSSAGTELTRTFTFDGSAGASTGTLLPFHPGHDLWP